MTYQTCRNIPYVNWYFLWFLFKTKKIFIFGLCFILYFLKLSGTNEFSRIYWAIPEKKNRGGLYFFDPPPCPSHPSLEFLGYFTLKNSRENKLSPLVLEILQNCVTLLGNSNFKNRYTYGNRTVSRTGTGTHQNFIIGCRYFLKMRRLYQTTGTNQQFFIRCRYFSCFYLFVTL